MSFLCKRKCQRYAIGHWYTLGDAFGSFTRHKFVEWTLRTRITTNGSVVNYKRRVLLAKSTMFNINCRSSLVDSIFKEKFKPRRLPITLLARSMTVKAGSN